MVRTRYPNIVNSGTAIIPLKEEEKKEQNTTLGCRNLLKYSSTSWYIYYKPKSCLIYKEMIQDDSNYSHCRFSYSFMGRMGAFASKCLNYGL